MRKILFAAVASLAALVATAAGANAAFTVSVTGFVLATPITNDAGAPTASGVSYASNDDGANGVVASINATAREVFPKISSLTSRVSISNGTGAAQNFTVTISQDAYNFPTDPYMFSNTVRARITGASPGSAILPSNVTVTASNQTTQSYAILSTPGTANYGSSVPAFGGSGPYLITQSFTINNLQDGNTIVFDTVSTIASPLPATALMAAIGLPLLGLAGAFRRRVLA